VAASEDDPDTIIDRTDMSFDLVYAFLQSNCIQALSISHDVCSFMQPDGVGERGERGERDVMTQLADVLSLCGDVDLMMSRKYDPSSLLDRSDTSCFPEGYASAILCRATAVARGVGSKQRYQAGKSRGAMGTWQPMYRPRILALRTARQQLGVHLQSLRNDLMKDGISGGGASVGGSSASVGGRWLVEGEGGVAPSLLSVQALVCDVVPVLRVLEAHQRLSDTLLWRLRAIHAVSTGGSGNGGLQPGGGDGEVQGDAAAAAWLAAVDDIVEFDD
jgi:hypothetical protein